MSLWLHPRAEYACDEWVTAREAAEYLAVPVETIRTWARRGKFKRMHTGPNRTRLFAFSEVAAVERRQRLRRVAC